MTEAEKNSIISAQILARVAEGATMREALDGVLGVGTYDRMVGELYDQLRAKASS